MQHQDAHRITIVGICHEADIMLDRLSSTLDMPRGELVDTLVRSAYHETFTADGGTQADPEPVMPAGASLSSADPAARLAARFHAERHAAWRARQAAKPAALLDEKPACLRSGADVAYKDSLTRRGAAPLPPQEEDPMPVRPPDPVYAVPLSEIRDWEDAARYRVLAAMAQEDRYQLALNQWRIRRDVRRLPKRA